MSNVIASHMKFQRCDYLALRNKYEIAEILHVRYTGDAPLFAHHKPFNLSWMSCTRGGISCSASSITSSTLAIPWSITGGDTIANIYSARTCKHLMNIGFLLSIHYSAATCHLSSNEHDYKDEIS